MSEIITLVIGAAVGVGAMIVKERAEGKDKVKVSRSQYDYLVEEKGRLERNCANLEKEAEMLLESRNKMLEEQWKVESASMDFEDDLGKAKVELSRLREENQKLSKSVEDYKKMCEMYETQLKENK